jgi:hypothetical protein
MKQMVSFRKLLERKHCYDFKLYTLKSRPELGKLWKLRYLPAAALLKVFKSYFKIEPCYNYYDYDFYITVHRC